MRAAEIENAEATNARADDRAASNQAARAPSPARHRERPMAGALATFGRRLARATATGLRSIRWRSGSRGDRWDARAQRVFLGGAVDASDLERRQRAWERDESNAYSLSGWR